METAVRTYRPLENAWDSQKYQKSRIKTLLRKGMDDGRGAGTRKKDSTRLGGRVGSWTDAPVHGPEAKSCKADRIYI